MLVLRIYTFADGLTLGGVAVDFTALAAGVPWLEVRAL